MLLGKPLINYFKHLPKKSEDEVKYKTLHENHHKENKIIDEESSFQAPLESFNQPEETHSRGEEFIH